MARKVIAGWQKLMATYCQVYAYYHLWVDCETQINSQSNA